jgi:uncharacterized membrane protein
MVPDRLGLEQAMKSVLSPCQFRALLSAGFAAPAIFAEIGHRADRLGVVLDAILGLLFLDERRSGANWAGAALIAAGAALVALKV